MTSSTSPQFAPGKACGSCMMCCKVPYITDFKKPYGLWCRHAVPGHGCSIYPDRPRACSGFWCEWMYNPNFGPEWKPDRAKFVVSFRPEARVLAIWVDPSFPVAWTKPPFYAQIKKWAVAYAERDQFVFVHIGPRLIVVLPDREVDMGEVDPESGVTVSRRFGVNGVIYDIETRSSEPDRGGPSIETARRERAIVWDDRPP
jgi:hypothetical protein